MTPRLLMWFGFGVGVFVLVVGAMGLGTDFGPVLAFGGGCLFGKGYGVWEERQGR